MSLQLGLRLLRGGGRAGLVRLALVSLGVSVGVLTVLLALAVPRLTSAQHERTAARMPVAQGSNGASGSATGLHVRLIPDQIDGRGWQHVLISGPVTGPVPPGLPNVPQPGQTFRSPALQELLASRGLLPDDAPSGIIKSDGLSSPDELLDYLGVSASTFAGQNAEISGFGQDSAKVFDPLPRNRIAAELVLLVGLPAAVYLSTCAQLSAATRARRLAALRLIGVGSRTIIGAAAFEAAAAGAVGAVIGLALFPLLNFALSSSNFLGFTWYSGDAAVTPTLAVTTFVAVVLLSARTGLSGMRRVLARPLDARKEPDLRAGTWWGLVPLLVGLGALIPFAVLLILHRPAVVTFTSAFNIVLLATVVSVSGLLLTLRPAVRLVVTRLTGEKRSLPMRLAARRLELDVGSALRVITGIVVVVLVASFGPAVLRDGKLAVAPPVAQPVITVAQIAEPQQRHVVFGLPGTASKVAVVPGVQSGPEDPASRPIVIATCDSLRRYLGEPLAGCVDNAAQRLVTSDAAGTPAAAAPGAAIIAPGLSAAPDALLNVQDKTQRLPAGAVLLTSDVDAAALPDRTVFFLTATDVQAGDALRFAIRDAAPTSSPASSLDTDSARTYTVLRGTTYLGMSLGFLVGLLAFLIATIDRALERRNNVAAMVVLGIPVSTLRRTQLLQVLVPLAVALVLAAVVGNVAGLAWLGAGGLQDGFHAAGLQLSLGLGAIGLVIASAAGLIVPGRRPKVEHLRRQ